MKERIEKALKGMREVLTEAVKDCDEFEIATIVTAVLAGLEDVIEEVMK